MSDYLDAKVKTFKKALRTFKEALATKSPSKLEKDGAIQRYEYSFELAWKCSKIYLEDQGISKATTPKSCLQQAFIHKIIKNEDTWLEMIQSRNLTVHTYNEKFANALFKKLPKYLKAMEELLKILQYA